MNPTDLLHFLLEAADQIRVLHWGTTSYPEHVALGDLYDSINDSTDRIAEALMGAQGERFQLKGTLELVDYAEGVPANYVRGIGEALTSITGLPTDILNLRDDLLAAVHKTSYLLTLSAEKPEAAEEEESAPAESAAPAEALESSEAFEDEASATPPETP